MKRSYDQHDCMCGQLDSEANDSFLQSAVTHNSASDKMTVYLNWTAPAESTGAVRFR